MHCIRRVMYAGFCIVLAIGLMNVSVSASDQDVPKNIIMVVGDGVGVSHITAARIVKGSLNLEEFTAVGLLTTFATDQLINSSPGATTAMATGINTKREYIGMDPDGQPLKSVLEYAQEFRKGTGLVVTSNITDSTPACFVAHMTSRLDQSRVAEAIVEKGVDVVMGGGRGFFVPHNQGESFRKDGKDLLAELVKTHLIVRTQREFEKMGMPSRVVALLDRGNLPSADSRQISLSEMTRKAIEILSGYENGFFLMVEGSQVDWAAHRGDGERIVQEMVDLDDAIGQIMDFAKRDKQTLVIFVSDHETGGYTILDGSVEENKIIKAVFLADGHTPAMVPLFAYGPGSDIFSGIHAQAFVGQVLIDYVKGLMH